MIKEFISKAQSGEIDIVEHTHKILEEAKKINKEYGYFTAITDDLALQNAKKAKEESKKEKSIRRNLLGVPLSVKDAICIKDVETTACSRILEGYKPVFNATVIEKCLMNGAVIIGKTVQDEFGFGGFSVNAGKGYNAPKNPFDRERSTGGSSGGCAGFTQKTRFTHVSLGESTGGSIAEPASFCGVVGLCPTYGRVSRYGLLDFANSLDKIGPIAKSVEDAAVLLGAIAGHDENESTSSPNPAEDYAGFAGKPVKGMKIAVIKEAFGDGVDKNIEDNIWLGIKKLEKEGAGYEEISLSFPIKYGIPAYYLLSSTEASTNLAKYCGMRYGKHELLKGNFDEYFTKVRSLNLGDEAKRRIMLGTFARMAGYRDAYYIKALKIRAKMILEYKKALSKFDALLTPTSPVLPPKFSDIEKLTPLQQYMLDVLTVGPNIAGLPHISIPTGSHKSLPIGTMLTGDHFCEDKLIQLGSALEQSQ